MSTALAASKVAEDEPCLVLGGIAWWQYEAIADAFPGRSPLRITYLDGRLTLLSPRRRHDWNELYLDRLVEAVALGFGIEWEPSGHSTYRREDVQGGVEGDLTYYFGEHAVVMRGPVDVDLSIQPPPDLAVEVELTHPADDSIQVWGRLGVPEVWHLRVDRETLTFGVRQEDGTYSPVPRSAAFPELEPADVLIQLRLASELGRSRWVAQLDGWVRTVLLPRRGV